MIYKKVIFILLFVTNIFATNILVLNSYRVNLEWTNEEFKAITNVLNNSHIENIQLYTEFMDTKIFRPTHYTNKNNLEYYTKKYKNIDFDIVITTDDNALNFVRTFKTKRIFKNSKVFFCGVNNLSLNNKLDKHIYAGVFEKKIQWQI